MSAKPKDYQRTLELVNKYILCTTQFVNRFAANVDIRLGVSCRTLQRLEAQIALLEHKLDSIDGHGGGQAEGGPSPSPQPATAGVTLAVTAPPTMAPLAITAAPSQPPPPPGVSPPPRPAPNAKSLPGGGGGVPALPPGVRGPNAPPPPPGLMGVNGARSAPPPPPGMKQPPLPPGMTHASMGGAPSQQLLLLAAPPGGVVVPPPGFAPPPPPPPPMAGGASSIRNHPRLQGYFKMQEAGVPVVAIKQKMQVDGYDPAWFDTPDAPASLPAVSAAGKKTEYDSD